MQMYCCFIYSDSTLYSISSLSQHSLIPWNDGAIGSPNQMTKRILHKNNGTNEEIVDLWMNRTFELLLLGHMISPVT
jgi:hypothetical protein